MSAKALGKGRVDFKPVPPKEKAGEGYETRIFVEYHENTLWAIPLTECLTWFVSL